MAGALEGIKILEVSQYIAMPSAIAILSDWGAEVIKVESTAGGDAMRGMMGCEGVSWTELNPWWEQPNRNKKSIAVGLWLEEGREIIYKLVPRMDVFDTNFTPPVVEKFALDYETLRKLNPRLIYGHLTGYGKVGPDKDRPGYDYVAFWARSGIMSSLGQPGTPPPTAREGLGDCITAGFMAGAIVAALYAREKTGKGQALDFSLYHHGVWTLGQDMAMTLIQGELPPRTDRKKVWNPLWNTYQTKDGVWMQFICLQSERYWPQFCQALGIEHLQNDPKFESHEKRQQNNVELISIIDSIMPTKTYDEWVDSFTRAGEIIYGRVQTAAEVINDPQALANNFFAEIDHPCGRKIRLINSPANFSETPAAIRSAAPALGQHTEEVLLDLGYSWEDIAKLKDKNIIL